MAGKKKNDKKNNNRTPRIDNRKARFNYFIEDDFETGIVLFGTEVKAIREGKANIKDSYATEKNGEIWLVNSYIAEYSGGNRFNHEAKRPRKLLLKKREISKIIGLIKLQGITLVPLAMYFNDKGYIKIKLGIAKGKKQYDKRADEKQRDWQRDKSRIMKHNVE